MEVFESKIEELVDLRDGFFEKYPNGTEADRVKAVRDKALLLLEDVPLSEFPRSAERYLQCGRILNACVAYDPRCEEFLSKAVKLDPDALAWLELGICLSKKPDVQFAIECVECSLELERSSRALHTLSMLLRAKMMKIVDHLERSTLQKRSSELAFEAVKLDPQSGTAHSCLGNSLFLEFFNEGQSNPNLMKQACDEYRLALQCGKEYRNADLHLNAGAAFRYEENYSEALFHFQQAVKYDPNNVIGSHERLTSLRQFLSNVYLGIQTTGNLRSKRITEFKSSLSNCSSSMSPFSGLNIIQTFKRLKDGSNKGNVIVGKIVASVTHEDIVPVTSVLMDVEGDCLALCVYNCASSLTFSIADTVAVADPFMIKVKDLQLPNHSNVSFSSIRVPTPSKISRNGCLPKPKQLAPSHLKISAL
ncbi:tetratricopeptide repeat protein [Dictyocaulus viviparus]|uniref:Tetratricopeptide repeat protein n=1 Tax=Dictyocaulus viviparus TaxID=29172 RepID=A0A0D8XFG1_DICVI|nr:tetratricopeptide repeat protein [Dictyocaulus viviparus]